MPAEIISMTRFNGGIAIGDKETITSVYNQNGLNSSWRFGYGVNVHDEPSRFSALPKSVNVFSGVYGTGTLQDEPRWIINGHPFVNAVFMYGSNGRVYQEDSLGNWTYLHTVPSSVGNGMVVYNNYLYCVADTTISQYGPLNGSPTWNDSWQTGLNSTNALGFAPCLVFGFGFAVGHGSDIGFFGNNITNEYSYPTAYQVGEVVSYGGQLWVCSTGYTSSVSTGVPSTVTVAGVSDATHWSPSSSTTPPYQWTSSAIQLPAGLYAISLARIEQYLAISTTGSTSVLDNEQGYVFMWDGSSPQWNFFNNIEQGSGNCIANYRNQSLTINGSKGMIYLGTDPFYKVHQLPNLPITGTVQVYPGAITSWQGKIYIGFGANSTDPNFIRGAYAWGAKVNAYPDALTCDYLISTGNSGSTVQITALAGMGNSLYIGWRDGNNVGIDKVIVNNPPQPLARINFLIFDDGRMPQQKKVDTIVINHPPLRVGEAINIYYRADRVDNPSFPFDTIPVFTHSYSATDPEPNKTRWSPNEDFNPRFYELEIGAGMSCNATTPYITAVSMKYFNLIEELKV